MAKRDRSFRARMKWTGFLLVLLAAGAGWGAWATCGFRGCPDLSALTAFQPAGGPLVLDRYGDEVAYLHPLETRVVPLDDLPDHIPEAFVAVEDRRFFEHRGVDWWRLAGAAAGNLRAGEIREGGSTLSMQLARTLFPQRIPGEARTFRRKLLELQTARRIENRFEKNEILELYLNHVYMGGGAYGIEAGARYYFDRPATELSLEEAALLAGVIRTPVRYDPRSHPERARGRRDLVLHLMEEQDRIGPEEGVEARDAPVAVTPQAPSTAAGAPAPFFVDAVRRVLEEEFGEALYRTPLRIHTTLDPEAQRAAEEELVRQLDAVEAGVHGPVPPTPDGQTGRVQGAVVLLDPVEGHVLALVGGRDFGESRYNRALLARRPTGSAFKPFVLAAGLTEGFVPSQPIADRPFSLTAGDGSTWTPRNHDGEYVGPVTMRRALVESRNVPIVRLALAVGPERVARAGEQAGLPGPIPPVPAAALGTHSASPLELARAYAGLAQGGRHPVPRIVVRVEDAEGGIVQQTGPRRQGGLDPRVTYILTDMLSDAVDQGTGRGVRAVGHTGPAAGKTGTTQEGHDAWFAGYTESTVGVIWIGHDQPRRMAAGATGGGVAAPLWGRIMARVDGGRWEETRSEAPSPWTFPDGIVVREVDPESGRVVDAGCPSPEGGGVRELFLEEFVPAGTCPSGPGVVDRVAGFVRGLFGSSEEEERAGGDSGPEGGDGTREDPELLDAGGAAAELLGAPRVPLAPRSEEE